MHAKWRNMTLEYILLVVHKWFPKCVVQFVYPSIDSIFHSVASLLSYLYYTIWSVSILIWLIKTLVQPHLSQKWMNIHSTCAFLFILLQGRLIESWRPVSSAFARGYLLCWSYQQRHYCLDSRQMHQLILNRQRFSFHLERIYKLEV